NRPALTEVFGTAPRELARAVSLQHAVEMVRVIIDVVEVRVDELAAPGGEAELREAVLTYARGIAFSAGRVYARAGEARGAGAARGAGRVGRPAGGARGGLAGPRRERGLPALVGLGAELVVLPRRGRGGHDRGRSFRRVGAAHRGDPRPGQAGPAGPAGRRAG